MAHKHPKPYMRPGCSTQLPDLTLCLQRVTFSSGFGTPLCLPACKDTSRKRWIDLPVNSSCLLPIVLDWTHMSSYQMQQTLGAGFTLSTCQFESKHCNRVPLGLEPCTETGGLENGLFLWGCSLAARKADRFPAAGCSAERLACPPGQAGILGSYRIFLYQGRKPPTITTRRATKLGAYGIS